MKRFLLVAIAAVALIVPSVSSASGGRACFKVGFGTINFPHDRSSTASYWIKIGFRKDASDGKTVRSGAFSFTGYVVRHYLVCIPTDTRRRYVTAGGTWSSPTPCVECRLVVSIRRVVRFH